jgi:hypothetical protein
MIPDYYDTDINIYVLFSITSAKKGFQTDQEQYEAGEEHDFLRQMVIKVFLG